MLSVCKITKYANTIIKHHSGHHKQRSSYRECMHQALNGKLVWYFTRWYDWNQSLRHFLSPEKECQWTFWQVIQYPFWILLFWIAIMWCSRGNLVYILASKHLIIAISKIRIQNGHCIAKRAYWWDCKVALIIVNKMNLTRLKVLSLGQGFNVTWHNPKAEDCTN